MTVTVKNESDLVVPPRVRRLAGIKAGDRLEFKVSGGVITILPKLPVAADEYTPEQRRIIAARLDAAEKGPFHGPFTAKEAAAFLKRNLRARRKIKSKPS
jgi:bifunctional DNA-binding transcriptional regulator/antitoxin component of YhaV-PrlF toxin-antitoxin module